jgi:hypothetical protein
MTNIILAAVLTVSVIHLPPLTPAQRFENAVNKYLMKFPESERLDKAIALFTPVTTKRRAIPPDDLILMELQRISSQLDALERQARRKATLKEFHIYDPIDNPHPYDD